MRVKAMPRAGCWHAYAGSNPGWIAVLFLCLYPFWFALGYEFAKKHRLDAKLVPILMIGVLLLLIPSVIESQFLAH
jgi:hypothetical protein